MSRTLVVLALAAASSVAVACTQHVEVVHTIKATHTCLETECTAFMKSQDSSCNSCMSRCGALQGCDPSSVCGSCSPIACTESMRTECKKAKWSWTIPSTATPGVEEACLAERDERRRCAPDRSESDDERIRVRCANLAKYATASILPVLDCLEGRSCDDWGESCYPASTFGDELCATMESKCPGACAGWKHKDMNRTARLLKPEVVDAAGECARQEQCVDVIACLDAWMNTFE
jgi:hypothetical protein